MKPPVPPENDTHDAKREKQESLKRAWEKRIQSGREAMKEWENDGDSNLKFIKGSCWNDQMDQQLPNSTWSKTTANRMHALVNGYMAATVYRRPNVNAKPTKKGKDAMQRSIVDAAYLNYCMRECKAEEHMYLATHDAIVYGAGAIELRLDKERGGIARMEWVSIKDVVVDPHANTVMASCGWVARRFTMNIHTARRVFKNKELKPDAEAEAQHVSTGGNASQHVGGGLEDERITLWRIWARGDDPDAEDSGGEGVEVQTGQKPVPAGGDKAQGGDKDEDEVTRYLRRSGNRRIILCMHHPVLLDDTGWPFILDHDEFPITLIRTHRVPGSLLPYSPLRPVKELQKQINWALTFLITQMRRTSQIKYVIDKSALGGATSEEAINKLTSLESEEVIVASGALERVIAPLKLEPLSQAPLMMLEMLQDQFDTISGFAEMFGGAENSRSATEASIKEERAQTLTDLMRQATEAAAQEILRHMLQISWSATPAETVAKIVGEDIVEMGMDQLTGQRIPVAIYWNENMTPEEIRAEVDVVLEPGSMRRVNRDQEVQDIINVLDRALGIGAQFPPMGLQPNPEAWLTFINSLLRRQYEAMGWVDGAQFLIPPEAVGLMPMEQPNQTMQIDQSTHMTEGNKTLHEAAPTMTLHEASPSLSLSYKEGNKTPEKAGDAGQAKASAA